MTGVGVTSEVEVDWRGLADYLVKFQIQDVLKLTVRELNIRTAVELSTLDSQIRLKFLFSMPDSLVFPETFSIDSVNAYIHVLMTTDTLWTSQLFKDMTTLPTMFEARLPAFWSVPTNFSRDEVCLEDETPFRVLVVRQLLAAPASVVECIQPAPTFQTTPVMVTVTGVDWTTQDVASCAMTSSNRLGEAQ